MEPLRLQWDMPDHPVAKHHLVAIGTVDKVCHATNTTRAALPTVPRPLTGDSCQLEASESCDGGAIAQSP